MNRGRPSKYSPTAIEAVYDYLDDCSSDNRTPFAEELAYRLRVDDSTLWHWTKKDEAFKEVYNILLTAQKFDLKRKMLVGEYPCRAAYLLLSSTHHVIPKRRIEIETPPQTISSNLSPLQLAKYAEEMGKLFRDNHSQKPY